MENINKILKEKSSKYNTVNNDITNNITNNVNNGASSKYSLNKDKFIPNTEETQLAEEIENKRGTKFQIKSPKKYFTWKFKKGLY